jgi:hypothetical protein
MIYYVLALALFHQDSYDDVAENAVGAWSNTSGAVPNKSSFTRARQRLGETALESVFRKMAGPVAPLVFVGAFYRGTRVAAVDGFVPDAPGTPTNRAESGGLLDVRGNPAGLRQVRVATLTEAATHASVDARVGAFSGGERELAVSMAGSPAEMLVIMDRGFPAWGFGRHTRRPGLVCCCRLAQAWPGARSSTWRTAPTWPG